MSVKKKVKYKREYPSEKAIETAILTFLNYLPKCYAWKNNSTGIYDTKAGTYRKNRNKHVINGVSDIIGIYRGRPLFIEVKRPCNKKRPDEQVNFIERIKGMGGIAGFATSVDDVREILRVQGAHNEEKILSEGLQDSDPVTVE
jgi:hypothetical protein